jgi:hypothetical protein
VLSILSIGLSCFGDMDHIAATAKRRSADAAQEKISVDRWQRLSGADLAPDPKTVALAPVEFDSPCRATLAWGGLTSIGRRIGAMARRFRYSE